MAKYIDADELLKRLNACKYPAEKTTMRQVTYNAVISDACRSVDAMPAADVQEVRHGRWKHTRDLYSCPDGNQLFYGKICSVCNNVSPYETPYCMNCGAKMDEGCTPLVADPILTRQTND